MNSHLLSGVLTESEQPLTVWCERMTRARRPSFISSEYLICSSALSAVVTVCSTTRMILAHCKHCHCLCQVILAHCKHCHCLCQVILAHLQTLPLSVSSGLSPLQTLPLSVSSDLSPLQTLPLSVSRPELNICQ